MAISLSTGLVNGLISSGSLKNLFESAPANGFNIDIFSNTKPANANLASGAAPLVTIKAAAGAPCTFDATPTEGVILKDPAETWSGTATAGGTAVWFRIYRAGETSTDADGAKMRIDGSCGTSGADMNLGTLTVVNGAPFVVTAGSFTLPKA